jgi:exosortase
MPQVNVATAREPFVARSDQPRAQLSLWWIGIFLALIWFPIVHHLRGEWSYNPQYSYGWSVPFLVLFLLWRRWLTRPDPEPCATRFWPALVIVTAVIGISAMRFLSEANPDWRFLSWGGAMLAAAASLAASYSLGGKAWLKHFAFPFLFFLVAVPWPIQIEQRIIQGLMQAVTALNVFGLHLAGIPALQHGNVIEVGSGLIGIEEACSGVRSLQATLMISLFLGELYSFPASARAFLVAAGALLAFLCNLVRTALLVYVGTRSGSAAIHAWHDPAGLTILLVCLFGLWLVSLVMRRRIGQSPDHEVVGHPLPLLARPWPMYFALASAVLLIAEGGIQLWYGRHQNGMLAPHWTVRWPNERDDFKTVPIPPEAQGLLQYNEGGGASWQGTEGHTWALYHFQWLPGRTAALFVKVHRPDVCLPASGMTLSKDDGIRFFSTEGGKLPIRSYRFESNGTPLHVFYCYWDARSSYQTSSAAVEEDWTVKGRIRAALRGQREVGAQMLELAVWGYDSDADAHAALEQELNSLITRA